MRFSSQTWAFWFSVKTVCSCSVCPVDEDKNSALNSCCPWINDKRDWIFKYLFFPVSLEAGRVTPTTPPPLSAVTKFHSSERRLVSRSTLCKNEDLSDVSGADVTCGEDSGATLYSCVEVTGSAGVLRSSSRLSRWASHFTIGYPHRERPRSYTDMMCRFYFTVCAIIGLADRHRKLFIHP